MFCHDIILASAKDITASYTNPDVLSSITTKAALLNGSPGLNAYTEALDGSFNETETKRVLAGERFFSAKMSSTAIDISAAVMGCSGCNTVGRVIISDIAVSFN